MQEEERLNTSPLKINEIVCIPSFKSICTYCLECMYDRLPQNDELSAELLDNISGKFAALHTYIQLLYFSYPNSLSVT